MLSCLSAVAENQPANKHRMTSELSNFAARLRESIHSGFQDECFDVLSLELFGLQFKHNSAYRKICEARGRTPKVVEHWTQIPAVPTAAFKELELTCLAQNERTAVFYSSGTTEQKPSRHFHNAESLAVYETSLWKWFEQNVFANLKFKIQNSKLLVLTPPPAQAPYSSLVHMFEVVRCELGFNESVFVGKIGGDNSWILDFNRALKIMRESVEQNRPLILLGTAFSFVHLLDFLSEQNLSFQLPPGSHAMETGGYKNRSRSLPKNELHALITQRLGVSPDKIICEYGMSELSSQAYDSEIQNLEFRIQNRVFQFPPWARMQIISPETNCEVRDGETGLIRVFDLANVFSVMAVQTEDLGIRRGDGFELIGRAQLAETRGCSLMTA
jgi:hypothetical protein